VPETVTPAAWWTESWSWRAAARSVSGTPLSSCDVHKHGRAAAEPIGGRLKALRVARRRSPPSCYHSGALRVEVITHLALKHSGGTTAESCDLACVDGLERRARGRSGNWHNNTGKPTSLTGKPLRALNGLHIRGRDSNPRHGKRLWAVLFRRR